MEKIGPIFNIDWTSMGCTTVYILQNYLRQLFKLRRWKSDALETTKKEMPPRQKKIKTSHPNLSEKLFLIKSKVKFLIFQKKSPEQKCVFLLKKSIEKRVTRKFDESLAKVSMKLSVAIRKFQRNFRWNFRWPYESFMKLSLAIRKFHETFAWREKVSWNFRMASESFTESFAETFGWPPKVSVKLSPNFRQTFAWLCFRCVF